MSYGAGKVVSVTYNYYSLSLKWIRMPWFDGQRTYIHVANTLNIHTAKQHED